MHNVLLGTCFPEAQLLPVWRLRWVLEGGSHMCIYLIDCLAYDLLLENLNLEVNQFLILSMFMWFGSAKVSRLQADAAFWKRFGLRVWVVFFIRHDI